MFTVLRGPVYRRLFTAQVVALAGTGLATVALALVAYRLAPEAAAGVLGTALAIKMVAYVFVAPLAAALLADWSRRTVMIGADVLRAGVALSLPFVSEVWQVYLLVFALQAASATFTPTFQSVIPDVLPDEEEFTAALSLSRLAYDLESVASPVLAAVLLLVVPAPWLFVGTAIGFTASALLVAATALPPRRIAAGERKPMPFGRRARQGIVGFVATPALRPVLALNGVVAAAGAFVLVQTVVIVRSVFGLDDNAVALLLAANGLGSMAAAIGLPRLLRSWPERRVMLGGAALACAGVALVPAALTAPGPPVAGVVAVAVLWLMVGVGWSAMETPVGRLIRRHVPSEELPGAFAAQFSLSHACWLVTYPVAGWLGAVGIAPTALILAALAGSAALTAARLWPAGRAMMAGMDVPEHRASPDELDRAAEVLRLLADRTRLEILALLDGTELSVSELAAAVGRPLPAVSQHLAKLRAGRLVSVRRDGVSMRYSQPDEHVAALVTNVLHHAEHLLYEVPPHHRR